MDEPQVSEMQSIATKGGEAIKAEGPRQPRLCLHIMAVVVLYKMRPSDSPTLISLTAAAAALESDDVSLHICIADNTPGGQLIDETPLEASYISYPENPGLALVYNRAIAEAQRNGIDWLLTLDQDTHLPLDFLTSMAKSVAHFGAYARVAAIVPRIFDGPTAVSPFRFVQGFLPRIARHDESGLMGVHASAINSASFLRVSALVLVGGYDERFPLNNSDTALFFRLDNAGYRMALAGNVIVRHELAIMQRDRRMTVARYRQLLKDEREFWDLNMSFLARGERLVRLTGRGVKSWLYGEDADFKQATLDEIRYRLFTRRSKRMIHSNIPSI